jgi:hypothetical protein
MENRLLIPRNHITVKSVFSSNAPMPQTKEVACSNLQKLRRRKSDESDNLGTIIVSENGARRNVDDDISSWRIEGG